VLFADKSCCDLWSSYVYGNYLQADHNKPYETCWGKCWSCSEPVHVCITTHIINMQITSQTLQITRLNRPLMMGQYDHLNRITFAELFDCLPWHSIPLARVKHNVPMSPQSKPRTDVSLPGQPPRPFFSETCNASSWTSRRSTYIHVRVWTIWFGWILHDATLRVTTHEKARMFWTTSSACYKTCCP